MDDKVYIIYNEQGNKSKCLQFFGGCRKKLSKPSLATLIVFLGLLALLILFPFLQKEHVFMPAPICKDQCKFSLVESVPEGVVYNESTFTLKTTFDVWKKLILNVKQNISIASSYWTLRSSDVFDDNSSWMGQTIFDLLYDSSLNRGIDLRIVQNYAKDTPDTSILAQSANAKVRKLNFRKFSSYGILHTKLWIFDDTHFYLGSANMDWRSLSQVKELGVVGENCTCLALDLRKIFESYWYLSDPALTSSKSIRATTRFLQSYLVDDGIKRSFKGKGLTASTNDQIRSRRVHRRTESKRVSRNVFDINEYLNKGLNYFTNEDPILAFEIPDAWPDNYTTDYNFTHPASIHADDGSDYQVYVSSSPLILNGNYRTNDIDAILDCINGAKKFIYISVMEYMPGTLYVPVFQYWPAFDEAIRYAAFNRHVEVKLIISWWKHSNPRAMYFLKSLLELTYTGYANIQIKIMVIPAFTKDQRHIPFARVNHNKIMVTDEAAYIGTSNWSADYFLWTGGIGITFKPSPASAVNPSTLESYEFSVEQDEIAVNNLRQQLQNIFLRDWFSNYTTPLQNFKIPRELK